MSLANADEPRKEQEKCPFEEALVVKSEPAHVFAFLPPADSSSTLNNLLFSPRSADCALLSIPRKLARCPLSSHFHLSTPKQHSNASSTGSTLLPRPSI